MAENKLDDQGYIILLRAIRNRPSWNKKPFDKARALIDLLFDIKFKESRVEGVKLMPGQLLVKKRELTRRWGWNRPKVDRFLKQLARENTELWAIKEEVMRASTTNPREMVRAIGTRITFLYWDRLMRQK